MENLCLKHHHLTLRLLQTLRPGLPASKIIDLPHCCILQSAFFLIPNFVFSTGYRQIPQSALHCSWLRVLSTIIFCHSAPTLHSSIPFCSGSCPFYLSKSSIYFSSIYAHTFSSAICHLLFQGGKPLITLFVIFICSFLLVFGCTVLNMAS